MPTTTLSRIRFDPPIDGLYEAAGQLPLGIADKLFLALEEPEAFPHNAHLLGNPHSPNTGSYFIQPMGMPVIEGFFGGDGARALEELGEDGAFAFAIDEIAALLGTADSQAPDTDRRFSLDAEEWIGGSYSHALPGFAAARGCLADAGDERIAFAGEAVSRQDYSTAHGAFDSGVAAVQRLFA